MLEAALDAALARAGEPLTDAERSVRSGLANRQVTIRRRRPHPWRWRIHRHAGTRCCAEPARNI
jgi:hypothetical protein